VYALLVLHAANAHVVTLTVPSIILQILILIVRNGPNGLNKFVMKLKLNWKRKDRRNDVPEFIGDARR
jgi:hypothetical protein